MKLTRKSLRALRILREHPDITANVFAVHYFTAPEHRYLFTAVSNQGNGACAGKKAWLAAGSFLGRLARAGLVVNLPPEGRERRGPWKYRLTHLGEEALKQHEQSSNNINHEN